MPNLVPNNMNDWMRRQELRGTDTDQRKSNLVPRNIADGVDLDDFLWSGRYYRTSASGTTEVLGYPTDGAAGTLEVIRLPTSTQAQQVFHDRVSGVSWIRWYDGATWGPWRSTGFSGDVYDTGWVNRAADLNAGFTELASFDSRRIGPHVYWRGRVAPTTDWGAAMTNNRIIDNIGAEWTPAESTVEIMASSGSGSAASDEFFRAAITSSSTFDIRPMVASITNGVYLTFNYISGAF